MPEGRPNKHVLSHVSMFSRLSNLNQYKGIDSFELPGSLRSHLNTSLEQIYYVKRSDTYDALFGLLVPFVSVIKIELRHIWLIMGV